MSAGVTNLFSLLDASGMHEAHTSLMTDYEQGTLKYSDLKHEVANGLVAISGGIRSVSGRRRRLRR